MNASIESAFDPLFEVNPRSQKYVKSPVLHNIDNLNNPQEESAGRLGQDHDFQELKQMFDFLPMIPDILIEDFIYENDKNAKIRKDQALFKTNQDLPHLSVLEKNACFFVSI